MGKYGATASQAAQDDDKQARINRSLRNEIPIDKLWDCDLATMEDQLYSDRALTDLEYADCIRHIIAEKQKGPTQT